MPYVIVPVKGGYKVQNKITKHFYSLNPQTLAEAKAQLIALHIHTRH
jgi:hypothetical protein